MATVRNTPLVRTKHSTSHTVLVITRSVLCQQLVAICQSNVILCPLYYRSFPILTEAAGACHRNLVNILHRPIKCRLFPRSLVFVPDSICCSNSIRSSNTLSGKSNFVLAFSAIRVWLVTRFYIFIL